MSNKTEDIIFTGAFVKLDTHDGTLFQVDRAITLLIKLPRQIIPAPTGGISFFKRDSAVFLELLHWLTIMHTVRRRQNGIALSKCVDGALQTSEIQIGTNTSCIQKIVRSTLWCKAIKEP